MKVESDGQSGGWIFGITEIIPETEIESFKYFPAKRVWAKKKKIHYFCNICISCNKFNKKDHYKSRNLFLKIFLSYYIVREGEKSTLKNHFKTAGALKPKAN